MSAPAGQMRDVMGRFATGVIVVTASDPDGEAVGTTVNAFSSVSLEPRLLLVCLARDSRTLAALRHSGRFAVNILGDHQRELSDRFAAKGRDARGHEVSFGRHEHGMPYLEGSLATIACRIGTVHAAGDHEIVVGEVLGIEVGEAETPLLFFRGAYSALAAERVLSIAS